jgi:hypothetical protein
MVLILIQPLKYSGTMWKNEGAGISDDIGDFPSLLISASINISTFKNLSSW